MERVSTNYKQLAAEGLWHRNPAIVGMLGICPLLAVSTDLATSIGLGIATLFVLILSNGVISLIRHQIDSNTRIPVQIMVIATAVTVVDLVLQAWYFELHQKAGLFIALIVTNCVLLARAEVFARHQPVHLAMYDGLMSGLGFLLVLTTIGGFRELLGQGTLMSGISVLWSINDTTGNNTPAGLRLFDQGFLLMLMPPGAFLCMGFIVAGKNFIDRHIRQGERQVLTARINVRQLN